MKLELKDMYKFLLSYTFPGLLLGVEIILLLYWSIDHNVADFLKKAWESNPVLLLIMGYAFSTILGYVIDGINQFFYEEFNNWNLGIIFIIKPKRDDVEKRAAEVSKRKFEAIADEHGLNTYIHCLEDDLYYPYEAWANISIVMVPGFFMLGYWLLYRLNIAFWSRWFVIPVIIYFLVFLVIVFEARHTLLTNVKDEKQFVDVFIERNKKK
jgi:hypothetical protein